MSMARPRRTSPRRIGLMLLICLALAGVLFLQRDGLRVHERYFSESRPDAVLDFMQLSERWTEATLREAFPSVPVTCYDYAATLTADRACVLEAHSVNSIPTLYSTFFFRAGGLQHISFNVPWWAQADARRALTRAFGAPYALPAPTKQGTLLDEWRPANGSTLVMNRRRSWNPLEWNSIMWRAPPAGRQGRVQLSNPVFSPLPRQPDRSTATVFAGRHQRPGRELLVTGIQQIASDQRELDARIGAPGEARVDGAVG